ncbi:hypothetical protein [Janibacter sp. G56]|uniref:hypothetical protein n=1 Tax=Janibacter sp. G56 TaxID=3418717 RepID=UPI003CFE4F90
MTQDTIYKAAADARVQEAGPVGFSIDDVVKGGRARVRRRRAGVVGAAGAVAALAVAAVSAGGFGTAGAPAGETDAAGQGAGATTATFAGCTLEPSTCDGSLVTTWMEQYLGTGDPSDAFVEADSGLEYVVPDGAWAFESHPADAGSVDVLVAPALGASNAFDPVAAEPDWDWQTRAVEILPGVSATVDSASTEDGSRYEMWSVREGEGHGALAVAYEGPVVDGWSAASVTQLLRDLLQKAPEDGSTTAAD